MLGVALGTEYCGAESAAIYDPKFWTFTVGMVWKLCILHNPIDLDESNYIL